MMTNRQENSPELILASRSEARVRLLIAAGVSMTVEPADIDEEALRARMLNHSPGDVAVSLSEAKARAISERRPGACVVASDQILTFEGDIFSKPHDREDACRSLRRLRGGTHELHVAVVCMQGGQMLWRHVDMALMTMRSFSDAFLESYLDQIGDTALDQVGAYKLEGLGAQLFDGVEGDYFTILGLPLLPLLSFLRDRSFLPS